ncbi:3-beta hydroxysteroid dehydrogenase [Actinomadura cremea]|nr:3-beta hydroxysteroid dehydrogenase [Actinomadura cremea]
MPDSRQKVETMRIAVFGATGSIGTATVNEALARGHRVTAIVRTPRDLPPSAEPRIGDATDASAVRTLIDHDVVISATRPPHGQEDALLHAADTLLSTLAGTNVRLLLVGGAATLRIPGTTRTVLQSPHVDDSFRAIAEACAGQHARCLSDSRTDWTYVSPPAVLTDGPRTGRYRLGTDELVVDPAGDSTISIADLAVALVDEAERPKHTRARFTVGY